MNLWHNQKGTTLVKCYYKTPLLVNYINIQSKVPAKVPYISIVINFVK